MYIRGVEKRFQKNTFGLKIERSLHIVNHGLNQWVHNESLDFISLDKIMLFWNPKGCFVLMDDASLHKLEKVENL